MDNRIVKHFFCFFLYIATTFLINGCITRSMQSQESLKCIDPIYDFSYPYDEIREYEPTPIPFPKEWVPQINYPELLEIKISNVVSMAVKNDDEIWFTYPLVKYTPSTGEIIKYTIIDNDGFSFIPDSLLVTKENILWTLGHSGSSNPLVDGLYLSRYNPEKNAFEVIIDNKGILFSEGYKGLYNQFKEDNDGNIWILFNGALIKYNPISNEAQKVMGEDQGYKLSNFGLEISNDGKIWTVGDLEKQETNTSKPTFQYIFSYDPTTKKIENYSTLEKINYPQKITNLFIDHADRLWTYDFGWLEINDKNQPVWHRIIRSPIFITDQPINEYQNKWALPIPVIETYDRYIWFTFDNGLARLDTET